MKRAFLTFFALLCMVGTVFSQGNNLTVASMYADFIDTVLKYHLQGDGVELSNGKFNNQTGQILSPQIGVFNRNNYTTFPFETGIVMTTGNTSIAAGPHSSVSSSTGVQSYSDQQIQSAGLATATMYNCAAIDFDFLAYADTFAFGYVFASNEYPNFVCGTFNDVFAFFLTGTDPVTGLSTTKNVAVIPGTVSATNPNGIPVSINTINGGASSSGSSVCYNGTYSNYFVANYSGVGVGFTGMTVALYAEGKINACETYHMHLGVCNIGDNSYDSGVFLQEKSFVSKLETKLMMREEWCLHEDIKFTYASGEIDSSYLVTSHGDTIWQEPFILPDAAVADSGWYYLHVHSALPCVDLWSTDSIKISVVNTYKPDLGPDQYLCTGEVAVVSANYSGEDVSYYWNTGDNTDEIEVITSGQYVLDVEIKNASTNSVCKSSDTVEVHFYELPYVDFDGTNLQGCTPLNVSLTNNSTTTTGGFTSEWTLFDENFNLIDYSTDNNPSFTFNDAGYISVKLVVTSDDGCKDSLIKWNYISASAQPQLEFSASPEISLMSETQGNVEFTSYLSDNIVGNTNNHIQWTFGDGEDSDELNPTHQYDSWGDYIVTLSLTTEEGCADSISHIIVIEDDLIFPNVITPNGDGVNDVWAIGNLNTDINPEDPDKYRHNELRISDRNGKVVYHVKNYDTYSKDGQIYIGSNVFDGLSVSDGVYYYSFTYKGKAKQTKYNGSITIIR